MTHIKLQTEQQEDGAYTVYVVDTTTERVLVTCTNVPGTEQEAREQVQLIIGKLGESDG